LLRLNFIECDLLDFDMEEVGQYTCHWCTARRLARNEPREEALREGAAEGAQIIASFKDHPYIRDLARNPLMLSAICLVNYFENGKLPKDPLCLTGYVSRGCSTTGTSAAASIRNLAWRKNFGSAARSP
jgi:hypothetical protein